MGRTLFGAGACAHILIGTIFPVDPRGDQDIAYLLSDGSQGHQNRHHDGSWYVKLKRTTYDLGRSFEQPDVRFAVKVGIGAALLATPAFIHASRPIFNEFKGQWAIVSYMVVMSSTVGQTVRRPPRSPPRQDHS